MKKKVIIICLATVGFGLTAFSYVSCNSSNSKQSEVSEKAPKAIDIKNDIDLVYDVSNRFIATITKEDLQKATTIADLVPKGATDGIVSFRDVKIGIVSPKNEVFAKGNSGQLNTAQLKVLQSADYSADYYIEAFSKEKNEDTGKIEEQCFVYYVSIIPEKEASYTGGKQALIKFLKNECKNKVGIIKKDGLKPGRVRFTVTATGMVNNIEITSTCGYEEVDRELLTAVSKLKNWKPAQNSNGENIDQEFVFFFGLQGC